MTYTTIGDIASVTGTAQSAIRKACRKVDVEPRYGRWLLTPTEVRRVVAVLRGGAGRPATGAVPKYQERKVQSILEKKVLRAWWESVKKQYGPLSRDEALDLLFHFTLKEQKKDLSREAKKWIAVQAGLQIEPKR
jgi:hypothetical protein